MKKIYVLLSLVLFACSCAEFSYKTEADNIDETVETSGSSYDLNESVK